MFLRVMQNFNNLSLCSKKYVLLLALFLVTSQHSMALSNFPSEVLSPLDSTKIGLQLTTTSTAELSRLDITLMDNFACDANQLDLVIAAPSTDLFDDEDLVIAHVPLQFEQKTTTIEINHEHLTSSYLRLYCPTATTGFMTDRIEIQLIDPKVACESDDSMRNSRRSVNSAGRSLGTTEGCE